MLDENVIVKREDFCELIRVFWKMEFVIRTLMEENDGDLFGMIPRYVPAVGVGRVFELKDYITLDELDGVVERLSCYDEFERLDDLSVVEHDLSLFD